MPTNADPFSYRGISFLTRKGKFKQRYLPQEKLQICGMSEADLDAFIDLFCPGCPYYVTTRCGVDDWFDPHRRLTPDEVVRHLLGNILPEVTPKHVAPRCWGFTRFVGIDVDYHPGEEEDFRSRCQTVRKAFRILGVPEEGVRVDFTPSGGKHYRIFLSEGISVEKIPAVLNKVGVRHERGRFEIFPSRKTGYRLPFALRPGREHDPTQGGKFIRKVICGEIPTVSWIDCIRRADAFEVKYGSTVGKALPRRRTIAAKPARSAYLAKPKLSAIVCGIPKQARLNETHAVDDRKLCIGPKSNSTLAMDQLFLSGITAAGTRTQATLDLAWHFRFVRRFSEAATCETLIDWVYRTGRETSTTVSDDLRKGTRHAEEHTKAIVEWMFDLPEVKRTQKLANGHFSRTEVEHVLMKLKYAAANDRLELVEFALRCLQFAKSHGACDESGWVVEIAAAEVLRRWPRCSGSWYVRKREVLELAGVLQVERKEWRAKRRPGRARTYRIAIPRALSVEVNLDLSSAIAYAAKILSLADEHQTSLLRFQSENDSKKEVVENNLKKSGVIGDRVREVEVDSHAFNSGHGKQTNGLSTPTVPTSKRLAISSLRDEYLSQVQAKNGLRKPPGNNSAPVSSTTQDLPAANTWQAALLNLPLPLECRNWLLRNNDPGMGIPKRYRLMIDAAQRSATINGLPTEHCVMRADSGSFGSLGTPEQVTGALNEARHGAIACHGYG